MGYLIIMAIVTVLGVLIFGGIKAFNMAKNIYYKEKKLYDTVMFIKDDIALLKKDDIALLKEDIGQIRHHLLLDILSDKFKEINRESLIDEYNEEKMKELVYNLKLENLQGEKPGKE